MENIGTGRRYSVYAPASASMPDWVSVTSDVHGQVHGQVLKPCNHKIGIYGWRKRCLYCFILLLMVMVIINLALTIWIIKVMDFSVDGMGRLRITDQGVRLEGESEFLKSLYASKIESRIEQKLSVESTNNLTLRARNSAGVVTNKMFLGESIFETTADKFIVKNQKEELLFQADDDEITIAKDTVRITGAGGAVFDGSIQTPILKAGPFQQLRLESPTRNMRLKAPEGISIDSNAGDISASCLSDLYLQSQGSISLNSKRIELRNIQIAHPTREEGSHYQSVYQLCSCENGRLFLAHPDDGCQADYSVCK